MKTIATELMNVSNDFEEAILEKFCQRLENGEKLGIHVDCIGHTRTEWVTALYVEKLEERYGERLIKEDNLAFYRVYSLKKES